MRKDLNCQINENSGFQKQNDENKQKLEEGMEMLGRAIECTINIAVKFADTLKSLTTTIAQNSRHECALVRNEFESSLSNIKREYTEAYSLNSSRIERIENHLRSIPKFNQYLIQPKTLIQLQIQLQPTARV